MKNKKAVAIILSFMLMTLLISPAYAQASTITDSEFGTDFLIVPQWKIIDCISQSISFEGGTAFLYSKIIAMPGTTNINADFRLEYKTPSGWIIVNTWHRYAPGDLLIFYGTAMAYEGTQYRFTTTAYVIRNGVGETVTQSIERTY